MTKNDKKRDAVLDILKGIAIFLVVAGHAIQYGSGSGVILSESFYDDNVFAFIYSFHMPLFMIISGYLFFFTIKKYSTKEIIISRFRTLVLPVLSYSIISFCLQIHELTDLSPIGLIKKFILTFILSLWFLWAIFYSSLAVVIVNKVVKDNIFVYILMFAASFFIPDIYGLTVYKFMFPFFVAGYLFGKFGVREKLIRYKKPILGVSFIVFVCLLLLFNRDSYIYTTGHFIFKGEPLRQLGTDLYRTAIGFAGSIFVISAIQALVDSVGKEGNTIIGKCFLGLGKATLGIYALSELMFFYAVPLLTKNLDGVNYLIAFAETVIVLVLSYIFTITLKKFKITDLLFFGSRK